MRVRTSRELGAILRDRRKRQTLSQIELSEKAGVSRKWVVEMEKGKARAELALVLRVLDALDLVLKIDPGSRSGKKRRTTGIDINAIVEAARKHKP
jgi:HTH-type transcriptional regulator/antitoxin HipB